AIRSLVQQTVSKSDHGVLDMAAEIDCRAMGPKSRPLQIGSRAPKFTLPGTDRESISSADLQGESTVLLFWNPRCGFCQMMLPDLRAWDSNRPEGAPRLVVLYRGNSDTGQAMQLKSHIAFDVNGEVAAAFGVGGTPAAVLINKSYRIASNIEVGSAGVFGLLG